MRLLEIIVAMFGACAFCMWSYNRNAYISLHKSLIIMRATTPHSKYVRQRMMTTTQATMMIAYCHHIFYIPFILMTTVKSAANFNVTTEIWSCCCFLSLCSCCCVLFLFWTLILFFVFVCRFLFCLTVHLFLLFFLLIFYVCELWGFLAMHIIINTCVNGRKYNWNLRSLCSHISIPRVRISKYVKKTKTENSSMGTYRHTVRGIRQSIA